MKDIEYKIAIASGIFMMLFAIVVLIIVIKDYVQLKKEIDEFNSKPHT